MNLKKSFGDIKLILSCILRLRLKYMTDTWLVTGEAEVLRVRSAHYTTEPETESKSTMKILELTEEYQLTGTNSRTNYSWGAKSSIFGIYFTCGG